jgi:hypothetical protein
VLRQDIERYRKNENQEEKEEEKLSSERGGENVTGNE